MRVRRGSHGASSGKKKGRLAILQFNFEKNSIKIVIGNIYVKVFSHHNKLHFEGTPLQE